MESEGGSQELQGDHADNEQFTAAMAHEAMARVREQHYSRERRHEFLTNLTTEERDRVADGEPYCFRCGKPASSFSEYWRDEPLGVTDAAKAVRRDEGTYNPETNRFACDACYIAIGMPVGEPGNAYGWKAP
jgi:hypothetical protein